MYKDVGWQESSVVFSVEVIDEVVFKHIAVDETEYINMRFEMSKEEKVWGKN